MAFVLIFVLVSLMYRHAAQNADRLALDAFERHEAHMLKRQYLIFALVGVLSMLAAWLEIGLLYGFPGWVYLVLGPLCWWHGTWSDRRRPACGAADAA